MTTFAYIVDGKRRLEWIDGLLDGDDELVGAARKVAARGGTIRVAGIGSVEVNLDKHRNASVFLGTLLREEFGNEKVAFEGEEPDWGELPEGAIA